MIRGSLIVEVKVRYSARTWGVGGWGWGGVSIVSRGTWKSLHSHGTLGSSLHFNPDYRKRTQ